MKYFAIGILTPLVFLVLVAAILGPDVPAIEKDKPTAVVVEKVKEDPIILLQKRLKKKGIKNPLISTSGSTVRVEWDVKQMFWIKKGIQIDIATIMEQVYENTGSTLSLLSLTGYGELVDPYGRKTREKVVTVSYNKGVLEKVNFDNFDDNNVFKITNNFNLHASLNK